MERFLSVLEFKHERGMAIPRMEPPGVETRDRLADRFTGDFL